MRSNGRTWAIILAGMVIVAYLAVFGLGRDHEDPTKAVPIPNNIVGLGPTEGEAEKEWTRAKHPTTRRAKVDGVDEVDGVPYLMPVFGYNKKRNRERWGMIYESLKGDDTSSKFSVVDYGADEGYFSISMAYAFPSAEVILVEMGGKGGSIWKKEYDVLKIQEKKIQEYKTEGRMVMCQTTAKTEHFYKLGEEGTGHDYQFVLSVFHWFTMPDRKAFEEVLVKLLLNAKTTFIELPVVGDGSPRLMKQVGSKYFVKWYDGRTDMQQIIEDALSSQGASGKVTKIGSAKWLPADTRRNERAWDRELFRVDMELSPKPYSCATHFSVYGCAFVTSPEPVRFSHCLD